MKVHGWCVCMSVHKLVQCNANTGQSRKALQSSNQRHSIYFTCLPVGMVSLSGSTERGYCQPCLWNGVSVLSVWDGQIVNWYQVNIRSSQHRFMLHVNSPLHDVRVALAPNRQQ